MRKQGVGFVEAATFDQTLRTIKIVNPEEEKQNSRRSKILVIAGPKFSYFQE